MSVFIFDDNLDEYTLGSYLVGQNNWRGSTSPIVVAFPDATPGQRILQGSFYNIWQYLNNPVSIAYMFFTLYFSPNNWAPAAVILDFENTNPLNDTGPIRFLRFGVDPDWGAALTSTTSTGTSTYLIGANNLPAQSMIQSNFNFVPGTLYFVNISINLFEVPHGPLITPTVGLSATVNVNGTFACGGGIQDTNIPITSTFTGDANFNKFQFYAPSGQGSGGIGNITLAPSDDDPYPTMPPAVINAKITSGMVEYIKQTGNTDVLLSQSLVEWMATRRDENVRISQAVVELITQGISLQTNNWIVKEI